MTQNKRAGRASGNVWVIAWSLAAGVACDATGGGPGGDAGPALDALPPDVTAPEVFFRAPFDGMTVGGVVEVTAEATDDRRVARVVFALAGAEQATAMSEPYT